MVIKLNRLGIFVIGIGIMVSTSGLFCLWATFVYDPYVPAPAETPAPIPPTPTAGPVIPPEPAPPSEAGMLSSLPYEAAKTEAGRSGEDAPAVIAMVAGYCGYEVRQEEISVVVKGNPLDWNVSPSEVAAYLRGLGLYAAERVNGDPDTLITLLNNGFPVIVRHWAAYDDGTWDARYVVLRGYNRPSHVFIVADPYGDPKEVMTFADFDERWRPMHRVYIVAPKPETRLLADAILGANRDEESMYEVALAAAQAEALSLGDAYAWYNLGEAQLYSKLHVEAAESFAKSLEIGLPEEYLRYRFSHLRAFNEAGEYQRVLDMTAEMLLAVKIEEIHYERGMAYLGLEQKGAARVEMESALEVNPRFAPAAHALEQMGE